MLEFMLGPGTSILKIGGAVLLISTGILLLIPVLALWTSSVYAVISLGAIAGLSGYYILSRP